MEAVTAAEPNIKFEAERFGSLGFRALGAGFRVLGIGFRI